MPEEAAQIQLEGGAAFSVRLIDCVGYMVRGALGQMEDDQPRMVTTPWYDHPIPMTEAAEIGTRKVITEHSTIGIVITTDGSISEIPREDYLEPEERVIRELQEIGKPFIVLLNSQDPKSDRAIAIAGDIAGRYGVKCVPVNCLQLEEDDVGEILKAVLYEFPMRELDIFLPPWVDALPGEHPMKAGIYEAIRQKHSRAAPHPGDQRRHQAAGGKRECQRGGHYRHRSGNRRGFRTDRPAQRCSIKRCRSSPALRWRMTAT